MSTMLGVISYFKTGDYLVRRYSEGDWVTGKWIQGAETTLTVPGSVQPVNGSETQDLPEGVSTTDLRVMYTAVQLREPRDRDVKSGTSADRVEIDGDVYRVWKVEYFGVISKHYRVTLIREGVL